MISRNHLLLIVALELAAIAAGAFTWDRLPERAPIRWNLHGQADGFGPRWQVAFFIPAINAGVCALLVGLPLFGPFRRNFDKFRDTYGRICVTITAGLVALHIVVLLKAAGYGLRITGASSIVVGLMIAFIGSWLSKVRRNFWVGIRTPWTIANEEVWTRTHRVGAPLFVAFGLVNVGTGLLASDELCLVVLIGGLAAILVWAMLYSLYWYRRLGETEDLPGS